MRLRVRRLAVALGLMLIFVSFISYNVTQKEAQRNPKVIQVIHSGGAITVNNK
jgi:hypothetical protein